MAASASGAAARSTRSWLSRQKRVSERERLFITYQYHDRVSGNQDEAARTLEMWKTAYPRDSRPPNALSLIYNRFGRFDKAVAEATEALRRSPGSGFPMSNLAFAYRGLGRYADARKVGAEAVKLEVATAPTRRLLYQLGIMMNDGSAAAQIEWSKSVPREYDLISAQAQVASFEGRLRDAETLYGRAADLATARSLSGTASGFWAHLAMTEAFYEDPRRASERVRTIVARTASAAESPGTIPRFRAAVALGLAGLGTEARELVSRARQRYPESTLTRTVFIPTCEAAIAVGRGAPAKRSPRWRRRHRPSSALWQASSPHSSVVRPTSRNETPRPRAASSRKCSTIEEPTHSRRLFLSLDSGSPARGR